MKYVQYYQHFFLNQEVDEITLSFVHDCKINDLENLVLAHNKKGLFFFLFLFFHIRKMGLCCNLSAPSPSQLPMQTTLRYDK